MTEQKIDCTQEEAAILAEAMQEALATKQAADVALERLKRSFVLFGKPRNVAPEATLLAVDPDAHYVRIGVPEKEEKTQ